VGPMGSEKVILGERANQGHLISRGCQNLKFPSALSSALSEKSGKRKEKAKDCSNSEGRFSHALGEEEFGQGGGTVCQCDQKAFQ